MSIGLNANNDGSGSVQVGGSDAITITSGLAVAIPQTLTVTGASTLTGNTSVTGNLTLTGNASGIIKSGTAVASTSGTSIDFTGIPSTAKRITVMFSGVSASGTSAFLIQLGTSSGNENTGYVSSALAIQNGASSSAANTSTAGFLAAVAINLAAESYSGQTVLVNVTANNWIASGTLSNNTGTRVTCGAGTKTTAAALDRVRITTVNGTDTFDAGSVNILWE